MQMAGQRREQSARSTGAIDGMVEKGHWEAPSQAMQIKVMREAASWHNSHASVADLGSAVCASSMDNSGMQLIKFV